MSNTAIYEAMAKAQQEFKGAEKSHENPFFKSRYAGLDDIWNAAKEVLGKHGLFVVQTTEAIKDNGACILMTRLCHVSGGEFSGTFPLIGVKDMQSMGSALTYARRYTLAAILGIVVEDDDGEGAQSRPQAPKPSYSPQPGYQGGPITTNPAAVKPQASTGVKKASEAQIKRLYAITAAQNIDIESVKGYAKHHFNIDHLNDLDWKQYNAVVEWVQLPVQGPADEQPGEFGMM